MMRFNEKVQANGMYQPVYERDNCGIGLYANLDGFKSHAIVKNGLDMLTKLDHRGGQGSDPNTGDGAGLMIQIPDQYFRKVLPTLDLPEPDDYAVGMFFFQQHDPHFSAYKSQINQIIKQENETLLAWRKVPTNVEQIGALAKESAPVVYQVFIKRQTAAQGLPFERALYRMRKQMERFAKAHDEAFYIPSFSSETIVFKGLLTSYQVDQFYIDLQDEDVVSHFSLVHSRFSTNTFPSWERAHPNRYLIHNGEINTLRGNINKMKAREHNLKTDVFGEDFDTILPILNEDGSDSSVLDNALEFLILSGKSPEEAAMMLIPEPYENEQTMPAEKRAFYRYMSAVSEEWDGPTSMTFTNGKQLGAILDRNGLRPARYVITDSRDIIYASEVGVLPVDEESIVEKNRLKPGEMLFIDFEQGRIIPDEEVKQSVVTKHPYENWLSDEVRHIKKPETLTVKKRDSLLSRQRAFGYTHEVIENYLIALQEQKKDPIGAMGIDTPLAVLSNKQQSLFNYFKQTFAQVTNPPIDAYRERHVISTKVWLGKEGDYLTASPENVRRIELPHPILTAEELDELVTLGDNFKSARLKTTFTGSLSEALTTLHEQAETMIEQGHALLILTDEGMNEDTYAIPTLLATSSLHQYLIRQGIRSKVSLLVVSGEVKEAHHFACLLGYGADGILPYLVYETYQQLIADEKLSVTLTETIHTYIDTMVDGVVKIMSKMGISTFRSYQGAQIFEAVGISRDVIDQHFTGTTSVLDGITLDVIEQEARMFHEAGFKSADKRLPEGSEFQWRHDGESHAYNPATLTQLQWAARRGDYHLFKRYTKQMETQHIGFLRHLLDFTEQEAIDLSEVEPVDSIVKRFKTGAMSYGSISREAHETLAIAMNRLGGKSNSGEGGEEKDRFIQTDPLINKTSAIKQVASARFGVDSDYLVHANELQIKMAQGAKPGEGGQLPGDKVYPWIANTRRSTPGVDLISPPPHHDIYSIEDLAQLIFDLKNANPKARISVKLAAKSGVGTISAGVAKGKADVISIVGYDGGTGASPKTSIKHTGLPLEIGLTEAHQTLILNGLRQRVALETDGKLLTGKDVVMSAILGAEEFGFATAPLVILGCVMMRVCHLDTCPVGVATQNPALRERFTGKPEDIENFMRFIAEDMREIMASLGVRTVDELVGQTQLLKIHERKQLHWKAKYLDLSRLLYKPDEAFQLKKEKQAHQLEETLDQAILYPYFKSSIEEKQPQQIKLHVTNIDRATGTTLGYHVTKTHGEQGLPEDTINIRLSGSSGQSVAAFIPKGMTIHLTGDANDYAGKGLSGGKLIIEATETMKPQADRAIIAGNVCFIGATSGEGYINGLAGERFAVRNSGANLVVEGVGDNGCEYMTAGHVVVIGSIGKNFAAGMSGGEAYLYTTNKDATRAYINQELVDVEDSLTKAALQKVKQQLMNHLEHTQSVKAQYILDNWETEKSNFITVIPRRYKLVTGKIDRLISTGATREEASLLAFNEIKAEKLKKAVKTK